MNKAEQPQNIEQNIQVQLQALGQEIEANAERVALLGSWPQHIFPGSLLERLPKDHETKAPGFDAGIACALNLIPDDKQKLAATLHANYSKEAVMQVRAEAAKLEPDSETCWWLAACSICKEGEINAKDFLKQIEDFKKLSSDSAARLKAAASEFEKMSHSFRLKDGVPFGENDGCIQGAYIAGYSFGSQYAANYGLYFIGTYENSLGLENFPWSEEKDAKGRAKSGPVFGSTQFVKCSSEDEWEKAIEVVKVKFEKK